MGAVHVELDQDLVALLEELHRPVKQAARELIVLELYRQGELSSGKAAHLLGLEREDFIRHASARGIPYFQQDDTHRLIPSRDGDESVLERLAADAHQLQELVELNAATNDRSLGEANLLPGIGVHELLFGVPYARIVNAAFTHAHP